MALDSKNGKILAIVSPLDLVIFSVVKSHPNLQMGVGVTSGDKGLIGGNL